MAFELACPNHAPASFIAPEALVARAPFAICNEAPSDHAAREALLDDAFGPARFLKTCQRLRDGSAPAPGLALVATDSVGALIGTLRLWPVLAGGRAALLLGPLAVAAQARSLGVGGALIRESLARAADFGHRAVLLVGDAPYYARFGFERRFTERLTMPGPVERARFLGLELVDGALSGARGRVVPAAAHQIGLPQAA
ncbi:N-acetyltransferase [Methylocystis sp. L43]|uniref:GNAT family N-acetyltransferase n=1 Tax=unclassified Methylocystis TaxID=2625913 RepID=UPI0018C22EDA|nr:MULTISPECIES: N-acetyltransferase [unclassified Methylocystis]MBG0798576.1 N-acetyltransferase [Methylocystis sp. L43]MBG0806891.1 N-acetyltransferase [Methylocystis sp. H15]